MSSSTPLANKTTISSRNKLTQLIGDHAFTTSKLKSTIPQAASSLAALQRPSQPPQASQIARNPALKTPAPLRVQSSAASRISNLTNGIPTSVAGNRDSRLHARHSSNNNSQMSTTSAESNGSGSNNNNINVHTLRPPATSVKVPNYNATSRISHIATSRLPPATARVDRRSNAILGTTRTSSAAMAANSRPPLAGGTYMNSRSPSVLSSVSSTHTLRQTSNLKDRRSNQIPDTNSIRKGLAKFSNPMECQRQFLALNQKLKEMEDTLKTRDQQVGQLQEQLQGSTKRDLCYALIVQYFSEMLKLNSPLDLPAECEQLKSRIAILETQEKGYKAQQDAIVSDYQSQIQSEQDLRVNVEKELLETRLANAKVIEDLSNAHRDELNDLENRNAAIRGELSNKIATLESELDSKSKELSELRSNYEALTMSFNKLEESLTKDKDARVKYAQEKVNQLQKDVDSLNSVLEMKTERMHALEKDSILLAETQSELIKQKEITKTLGQQLESLEAALEKRKEQYEILIAEHEKIRQELKHERLDRRRTTVRKSSEIFSTP